MTGVEVITFPSAEAACVAYLKVELAARGETATVATKVPAQRPARLVRVRRLGGVRYDVITDAPMVSFDCWAATEVDAEALASVVRALVASIPDRDVPGGVVCCDVEEGGGPVNQPDPDTNYPRYTFFVMMHVRGFAL
jgi:hypothetical protein